MIKYYSKGRDIMRNCKLNITIALGCILIASPVKAFFPVCDYCELPTGVVPQITLAAQNLSEMKTQLSAMTENLRAIGDVRQTITAFSKDDTNEDDVVIAAVATRDAVDMAFANNIVVQDKVMEIAQVVNDTHKSIINAMVSQVEQEMKIASVSTPNIEIAQNDMYIPVIEENEEEAVDVNEEKESVQKYFEKIKNENNQLYVKMNDLFESSISVMNESAELNQQALRQLKTVLKELPEITDGEKAQMQERTNDLIKKEQENSDLSISLMEDIQVNYSKQYQEKIAANLNNYQKMVQAYIEGNVTAKELREAGNTLKTEVNAVNIFADSNVFAQYNQESEKVKSSTTKLVEDINQWAKEENKS